MSKIAIIVDGGFIRTRLQIRKQGNRPLSNDIYQEITSLVKHFPNDELFRIFYYDSVAFKEDEKMFNNPVDDSPTSLFGNINSAYTDKLYSELVKRDDVAFRYGGLGFSGWNLKNPKKTISKLSKGGKISPSDFCITVKQKGVDIKMGLDIAWLSMKGIVNKLIIITGDSDLVPALKFARKEGIKVYLSTLGQKVKSSLVDHADRVIK